MNELLLPQDDSSQTDDVGGRERDGWRRIDSTLPTPLPQPHIQPCQFSPPLPVTHSYRHFPQWGHILFRYRSYHPQHLPYGWVGGGVDVFGAGAAARLCWRLDLRSPGAIIPALDCWPLGWLGLVVFVVVWYGVVWWGLLWCGLVLYGMVWYDVVWYGMVWYGMVWCGMVWCGMVWCGMVWYGMVWYGMVRVGMMNGDEWWWGVLKGVKKILEY